MKPMIIDYTAIPAGHRQQALTNITANSPNTKTIDDPAWVEPDPNPDNEVAPKIKKYTDLQWLNERLWRVLQNWNDDGEQKITALAAIKLGDISTE